jgi:quercetin dioxygenase-like cupin family protein
MNVLRWSAATPPGEEELLSRMRQEGLSPYRWSNGPGDTYTVHSHSYEKVLYCAQGSIRFVLPDQTADAQNIDLAPGDCMILPPDVRHSAIVGARGVVCLEARRPTSREPGACHR